MPGGAVPHAIAIDADDVVVSRAPLASSARNSLSGRITAIERDARGPLLTVDCSGVALRARITAASLADLALAVGTPVWLTFKASSVHVLRDG
jgi:molybdopterin-binding protein